MQSNKIFSCLLLVLFSAAMFFCIYSLEQSGIGTAIFITIVLAAAIVAIRFLLKRDGMCRDLSSTLLVMAPFCALLLARISLLDVSTTDYEWFLHPWYETLKGRGGFAGLDQAFANYNIPYLTWLALFTYIPVRDLYMIKLLSVLFDAALAYFMFKITSQLTDSPWAKVICFTAAMILPTVFINGAVWGQCDSIYAAFIAAALYFAIRKPKREFTPREKQKSKAFQRNSSVIVYICAALALGYKLQAIFVFPIFIALIFTKRVSLKYFWVFPLTYIIAISPALLAGRGFIDTLTIYSSELGTVGTALNYNSPSMFSLRYDWEEQWSSIGTLLAFAFALLILIIAYVKRKRLSNRSVLTATLLLAAGVPLFLPHMHDRYFFLVDVLLLPLVCVKPKLTPLLFLSAFASLLGYYAYFTLSWFRLGTRYLTMNYGFYAMAVVILTVLVVFVMHDRRSSAPPPLENPTASIRVTPEPVRSRKRRR